MTPRDERKQIDSISIDDTLRGFGFIPEDRNGDPWLCAPEFHAVTSGTVTLSYSDGTTEEVRFNRTIIE